MDANQTFNFTPVNGYHIETVLADNVNNPAAVASGTLPPKQAKWLKKK